MYQEKCNIEVITIETEIIVYGLNLQSSGLPINFNSLGIMWDNYTEDIKNSTPNRRDKEIEYAVCLNKVPDYIVGVEITEIHEVRLDLRLLQFQQESMSRLNLMEKTIRIWWIQS